MSRAFAIALLLGTTAAGCGVEPRKPLGDQCDLTSECDQPLVCRLGRCRRECASLRDCPIDAICASDNSGLGACTLPDENDCLLDSECPTPLVCRFSRCVNACVEDTDCPSGSLCEETDDGRACRDPAEETCLRTEQCPAGTTCARDGRCRPFCRESRDCREGTVCEAGVCVVAEESLDGGPPGDGGADGGGVDGGLADGAMDGAASDGGPMDGAVADGFASDGGPECTTAAQCPDLLNGTRDCVGGSCTATCGDPFLDCDGYQDNGCEVNPETNRDHCGGCGMACPAGEACLDATCVSATVTQIDVGDGHACARWSDGRATCWGATNAWGILGTGAPSPGFAFTVPVMVEGLSGIDEIRAGRDHTCARVGGEVWCWGRNPVGQVGVDPTTSTEVVTPTRVTLPGDAVSIATGKNQSYAVLADGTVWGWGVNRTNGVNALGIGTSTPSSTHVPTQLAGAITDAERVVASSVEYQGCVLRADGTAPCWGLVGGTGWGSPTDPTGLPAGRTIVDVGPHELRICYVLDDGTAWCLGDHFRGSVPIVASSTLTAEQVDGITNAAGVSGGRMTLLWRSDGTLACWNDNEKGQCGTGVADSPYSTAQNVPGLTDVVQAAGGVFFSCALESTGAVYCAGDPGDLGSGTVLAPTYRFEPVAGVPR